MLKKINLAFSVYIKFLRNLTFPKFNYKLLITLATLAFVGVSIAGNADKIIKESIDFKSSIWLLIALSITLLSIIVNAFAWKMLFYNYDKKLFKLDLIALFVSTNIYKYLPGGVWHLIARLKALRSEFDFECAISTVLFEPILMLVAGLILLPLGGLNFVFSFLCLLSPLLLISKFRAILVSKIRLIKFSKIEFDSEISLLNMDTKSTNTSYPLRAFSLEILFVLIRFCGFWCCLHAFSIGNNLAINNLISSFSLAWILGLVIPAAPGGVGVFESAIILRIGSIMPEAGLLASLLCYRLVSTFADILGFLLFSVSDYFSGKSLYK